jgi:LEA14-like dessication related protein
VSFTEKTNNLWNYVITLNFEGNNPNERDVFIGEYDLDLYVNDRLLSKITNSNPLVLKANGTTSFSLKTIVSPSGAFSLFWKKLRNKRIEYRVSGTFYLKLGVVRLPFTINLLRLVDNPDE